jgi:hypothetical protein
LKKIENDIQLDVRKFCEDICSKVEEWDENVLSKGTRKMRDRASKLLRIYALVPFGAKSTSSAHISVRAYAALRKMRQHIP